MNNKYKALFIFFIYVLSKFSPVFSQNNYKVYYEFSSYENFLTDNEINTKITISNFDISFLDAVIFHLTNIERVKNKLDKFKFNDNLYHSSILHSNNMIEYEFFDHINEYEEKWRTPFNRILHFDSSYTALAENIVENNLLSFQGDILKYHTEFMDDGSIVYLDINNNIIPYSTYYELGSKLLNQWMKSPPHKKNILNTSYNLMGCACAIDINQVPVLIKCTQNFGRID